MNSNNTLDFESYLKRFTKVELPVQLDENSYQTINQLNEPLPDIIVSLFVDRIGKEEDLAEYVPVFRLPDQNSFVLLVYWRAGILQYDYILVTYTQDGHRIDQKVISSIIFTSDLIHKSVAQFDAEGLITVVEGVEKVQTAELLADRSKHVFFEVLEDGTIQQSIKFSL
jgi:DNA-binding Lrp family transcriptional regulator